MAAMAKKARRNGHSLAGWHGAVTRHSSGRRSLIFARALAAISTPRGHEGLPRSLAQIDRSARLGGVELQSIRGRRHVVDEADLDGYPRRVAARRLRQPAEGAVVHGGLLVGRVSMPPRVAER